MGPTKPGAEFIHLLKTDALRQAAAELGMSSEDTERVITLVSIYTSHLPANNNARFSVRLSPDEMEDRAQADAGLSEAQRIWKSYTEEA